MQKKLKEQYLHIRKLESQNKPVAQSLYDEISEDYLGCCIGLTDEQYDDFMENDNEDRMDFIEEWLVDNEELSNVVRKYYFEYINNDRDRETIIMALNPQEAYHKFCMKFGAVHICDAIDITDELDVFTVLYELIL